ncbi:serine hydrolase domain-containing protein [Nocardia grenadensis]|uniref:serine hydrolase domain-containing protein n=1 Tax=Nocardia grenadensis TaxID=931537 RepID=UPI003D744523
MFSHRGPESGRPSESRRDTAFPRWWRAAIATTAVLVLACGGRELPTAQGNPGQAHVDNAVFPGRDWERTSAADSDFDPHALETLTGRAQAGGSACLAVVRDGKLVVDERDPHSGPDPRETFSVTKSLTGLLVGIAVRRGELSVSDKVADHVPEWRGTPSESVTVEHLLTNTSGRQWDAVTDYAEMAVKAPDKTAFAIGLGQARDPGTEWVYNNSAVQVLSRVLHSATGVHPSDYARLHLFGPLGMRDSHLERDRSGGAMTFMGLRSTCPDIARLGVLMLHEGAWNGEQIIDADYAQRSVSPSTDLNRGYGRLWWLNSDGLVVSPAPAANGRGEQVPLTGPLVPDAGPDTFWAIGFRNQTLAVMPDKGIVAVRLGPKPPEEAPFGFQELTVGVLEATTDGR